MTDLHTYAAYTFTLTVCCMEINCPKALAEHNNSSLGRVVRGSFAIAQVRVLERKRPWNAIRPCDRAARGLYQANMKEAFEDDETQRQKIEPGQLAHSYTDLKWNRLAFLSQEAVLRELKNVPRRSEPYLSMTDQI
jgi:hypothetical protein